MDCSSFRLTWVSKKWIVLWCLGLFWWSLTEPGSGQYFSVCWAVRARTGFEQEHFRLRAVILSEDIKDSHQLFLSFKVQGGTWQKRRVRWGSALWWQWEVCFWLCISWCGKPMCWKQMSSSTLFCSSPMGWSQFSRSRPSLLLSDKPTVLQRVINTFLI